MNTLQARELLLLHSFRLPALDHPKMTGGFLGSLRPYQGLNEGNYHEVMEAIYTLAPQLQGQELDREIVSALWSICYLARLWALEPDGMLQRNGLITVEEVRRLEEWVNAIGWAVMMLLEGGDITAAFDLYPGREEI
jgi:hypothetical protein